MSLPRDLVLSLPSPLLLARSAPALWRTLRADAARWRTWLGDRRRAELGASIPALLALCPELDRELPRPWPRPAGRWNVMAIANGCLAVVTDRDVRVYELDTGVLLRQSGVNDAQADWRLLPWREGLLMCARGRALQWKGDTLRNIGFYNIEGVARLGDGTLALNVMFERVCLVRAGKLRTLWESQKNGVVQLLAGGNTVAVRSLNTVVLLPRSGGKTVLQHEIGSLRDMRMDAAGSQVVVAWNVMGQWMQVAVYSTRKGELLHTTSLDMLPTYYRVDFCLAMSAEHVAVTVHRDTLLWAPQQGEPRLVKDVHPLSIDLDGGRLWVMEGNETVCSLRV